MIRPLSACVALFLVTGFLGGCVAVPSETAETCDGRDECGFVGAPPLQLSRDATRFEERSYAFRRILANVAFDDVNRIRWFAPRGILTDGASIPPLFVPVLGDPRLPEYEMAAALHDAYCGYGNEAALTFHSRPWREVHRMFYQALRAGGTDEVRAKTIYAAVMLAGPRWERLRSAGDPPGPRPNARDIREEVSAGQGDELVRRLRILVRQIRSSNPGLDEIDAWVGVTDPRLKRRVAAGEEAAPVQVAPSTPVETPVVSEELAPSSGGGTTDDGSGVLSGAGVAAPSLGAGSGAGDPAA